MPIGFDNLQSKFYNNQMINTINKKATSRYIDRGIITSSANIVNNTIFINEISA